MSTSRLIALGLGALSVIFLATALLTGELTFLLPVALAVVLWVAYLVANRGLARKATEHSGSAEAALGDNTNPFPSAHLGGDDTPLGDTSEAHDEITEHDLPKGHPGRPAAERMAHRGGGLTTRGHADPSAVRDPATPGDEHTDPDRSATVADDASTGDVLSGSSSSSGGGSGRHIG